MLWHKDVPVLNFFVNYGRFLLCFGVLSYKMLGNEDFSIKEIL